MTQTDMKLRELPEKQEQRRRGRPKGSKSSNVAGEVTRAKLIEVSLDLFSRRGFSGVSIGAVSDASGVAKGSITHHFPNKKKLYEAVLGVVGEGLSDACGPAFSPSYPLEDRLNSFVSGVLTWAWENEPQARLMAFELLELPDRGALPKKWVLGRNLEIAVDLLRDGQEKGLLIDNCTVVTLLEVVFGLAIFNAIHKPFASLVLEKGHIVQTTTFTEEAGNLLKKSIFK